MNNFVLIIHERDLHPAIIGGFESRHSAALAGINACFNFQTQEEELAYLNENPNLLRYSGKYPLGKGYTIIPGAASMPPEPRP